MFLTPVTSQGLGGIQKLNKLFVHQGQDRNRVQRRRDFRHLCDRFHLLLHFTAQEGKD